MAQKKADPPAAPSVFAANLRRLVDGDGPEGSGSVNGWAMRHKLTQPSVRRLLLGKQSPTEKMLETIAERLGLEAWHLLVPDMRLNNPPVLREASDAELRLYRKLRETIDELAEFRDQGSTRPGAL